jgi:allantoinase
MLADQWLLPGLVDTHVHINDPGRADWEGFETATRAALAGGVTTLVDMPLNAIPATNDKAALMTKRAAAQGHLHADVAFWGGVVPGNAAALEGLAAGGVRGFKCFLSPSGVEEFEHVSRADLELAAPVLARLGLPLLVHAEDPACLREMVGDTRRYESWLESRPVDAEVSACRMLAGLSQRYGLWIHVVHVACTEAAQVLLDAIAAGAKLTLETCPHYLCFAAEDILAGSTFHKCAPPIREELQRDALWARVMRGEFDLIASDHSPCSPEFKLMGKGDFAVAWGGIASLELGLSALWTEGQPRGVSLPQLVRLLAQGPAQLAGLQGRKGVIAVGADADLVAFDPDARWSVGADTLHQRHAMTPYGGQAMKGRVTATWLRGERVWDGRAFAPATGRMIPERVE